jgi:hypothetical protein
MAASENGIEVIPANKYGMLLSANYIGHFADKPYAMPPSMTAKIYPCVEIEWPFLVELEDDYPGKYTLEMRKTPVVRIYCRHQAKYNDYKVKPTDTESGNGTEKSPYVAIGTAIEHAVCLIEHTCVYVQVYIMLDSDEVFILNYGSSTFDSADNRLLIGSTDGETYFKLSDTSESPNGQHVADAIVCQCRYTGDKAPCNNRNLDYFDIDCVSTQKMSFIGLGYNGPMFTEYLRFSCRNVIKGTFNNLGVNCRIMYNSHMSNLRQIVPYQYNNNTFTRLIGGGVSADSICDTTVLDAADFYNDALYGVSADYIHNCTIKASLFTHNNNSYGEESEISCDVRSVYNDSIISETYIENCIVYAKNIIGCTIISHGGICTSMSTLNQFNYMCQVVDGSCSDTAITFSTTCITKEDKNRFCSIYSQNSVLQNVDAKCTVTLAPPFGGELGSGWLLTCGIMSLHPKDNYYENVCVSGCKSITYGDAKDPLPCELS